LLVAIFEQAKLTVSVLSEVLGLAVEDELMPTSGASDLAASVTSPQKTAGILKTEGYLSMDVECVIKLLLRVKKLYTAI